MTYSMSEAYCQALRRLDELEAKLAAGERERAELRAVVRELQELIAVYQGYWRQSLRS